MLKVDGPDWGFLQAWGHCHRQAGGGCWVGARWGLGGGWVGAGWVGSGWGWDWVWGVLVGGGSLGWGVSSSPGVSFKLEVCSQILKCHAQIGVACLGYILDFWSLG